jgi:hypothetical protein
MRRIIIRIIAIIALPIALARTIGARLWIENKYTARRLCGDMGEDFATFARFWREA